MRSLVGLVKAAARSNVRRISTPTSETTATSVPAPKSMIQVPAWGLVGLGGAAAGFFGKVLHNDNLETRRELREDNKELRAEMKAGFEKIDQAIASLRPAPK